MTIEMIDRLSWIIVFGAIIVNKTFFWLFDIKLNKSMYDNYDFKPCLAKSKVFFIYMEIAISIHQMADKSV